MLMIVNCFIGHYQTQLLREQYFPPSNFRTITWKLPVLPCHIIDVIRSIQAVCNEPVEQTFSQDMGIGFQRLQKAFQDW